MAISEESRHRLYGRLEAVLGREDAATLMEHLPPVGWADVATKRDLDHAVVVLRADMATLESGLRADMATLGSALRAEMATLGADGRASLRALFLGLVALQVSGAGLALAVARLA